MNRKSYLLTPEGFENLESQLNTLRLIERPKIIDSLNYAVSLGDLPENAEYDAALKQQTEIDKKIEEIEHILENTTVVTPPNDSSYVSIGSNVEIMYLDDNEIDVYKLVGSKEVNSLDNKISNESPLGSALLNKKVNDIVEINLPTTNYKIKILRIFN